MFRALGRNVFSSPRSTPFLDAVAAGGMTDSHAPLLLPAFEGGQDGSCGAVGLEDTSGGMPTAREGHVWHSDTAAEPAAHPHDPKGDNTQSRGVDYYHGVLATEDTGLLDDDEGDSTRDVFPVIMGGLELDAGPTEGMTLGDAFSPLSTSERADGDVCAAGDIWVPGEDILTGGGQHMWCVDSAAGAPDFSDEPQSYVGENGGDVDHSGGDVTQDAGAVDIEEGVSTGAN